MRFNSIGFIDALHPPNTLLSCRQNRQVPSGEDERIVGYEDPAVHQVFWFKLRKGDLAYIPKLDKYFKLHKIA